jgi:hypothetical protein
VKQFGRYQIVEELGRGAMGVVYKALDPAIGRTVAVKTIVLADLPDPAERARVRNRLLREAQSAGSLSHPNIVTIYDVVEEPDLAYVVMEYVAGRSFDSMLREKALPERSSLLRFLHQVSGALDYAHHKGIVHRDIKPANIIVSDPAPGFEPLAKVTDFGVAKFVSHEITFSGAMIGTPNYMSPEQIQGLTIDGRSDQFSLAVMTYELLSGQKPFEAENLPALFYQICRTEPEPVDHVNPSLGALVWPVLSRALSKEPDSRFSSCAEFIDALAAALAESPEWHVAPTALVGAAALAGSLGAAAASGAVRAERRESPPLSYATAAESPAPALAAAPATRPLQDLPALPRRRHGFLDEEESPEQKSHGGRIVLLAVICACLAGLIVFAFEWKPPHGPPPQTADNAAAPLPAAPLPPEVLSPAKTPETAPAAQNSAAAAPAPSTSAPAQTRRVPEHPTASSPATAPQPSGPETADVDLLTEPPGAKMIVDDNPQTTCTSPCSITLTNGRHTLAVEMNGYETARRIFNVPDDTSLYVPLAKSSGVLVVTSSPPGSSIFIDGRNYGHTPQTITVPPGSHTLELVNGPLHQQQTIEVQAGSFIPVFIRWGRQ